MKSKSTSEINATKAKFIGLFVTSLILCVAVTAAFWGPFPGSPARQTADMGAETGFSRSRPGKQTADPAASNEQLNASLVSDAEKALRASIDSLHGSGHSNNKIQVDSTLNLFREAIKNPRSIAVISDALNNRHKPESNGEELTKLKDELLVKEGQVVSLQNQLKTAQNTSTATGDVARLKKDIQAKDAQIATLQTQLKTAPKETAVNTTAVDKMKNDLQTKDAQIAKLMNQLKTSPGTGNSGKLVEENKKLADENSFLKWAVRSEVSSNHNLTNLNSSLKQANATLQSQVNELKKGN